MVQEAVCNAVDEIPWLCNVYLPSFYEAFAKVIPLNNIIFQFIVLLFAYFQYKNGCFAVFWTWSTNNPPSFIFDFFFK